MSNDTNPSGSDAYLDVAGAAEAIEAFLPDDGEQENEEPEVTESKDDEVIESDDDESLEIDDAESDDELDEDEIEASEDTQEPKSVKVKVDGEELEVTLDELKSGYSRTQDYTRKTQEVANLRKEVEAERQAVTQEREQYSQLLGMLEQQLSGESEEPDWDNLRNTDPIEYSIQWTEWQRGQQKRQAISQERVRLAQMQQQEQLATLKQQAEREKQALQTVIPQWKDAEVAKKEKALILSQGKKLGFSDEELQQVFDHRAVVALRKAALYDQMMEKRKDAKPVQATKTVKAGIAQPQNKTTSQKQAIQRVQQTGKVRDAAKAFESILFG